jgi:hypothetical protein
MIGRYLLRLLRAYFLSSARHARLLKSYPSKRLAQVGAEVVMVAALVDEEAGKKIESAQAHENCKTRR